VLNRRKYQPPLEGLGDVADSLVAESANVRYNAQPPILAARNGAAMKQSLAMLSLLLTMVVVVSSLASGQGTKAADSDAVATITKLENDAVKADLAGDASFYQNNLADDWTGGTSRGTWDTKPSVLADMKDTKNNKTNSERISELKVRVHGDVAIATYKSTYDSLIKGQQYARTILSTDTFLRLNGAWKEVASHSSQAAK
jgi:ketosteroid isomerase-like protein